MADFLSEQLTALEKRLKDLRPQVEEYLHLEQVKEALEGVGKPRRGPGRPRGSTTRRSRPATSTTNPGITVSELGRKLNIKQPNYLYRVMNQLQSDGAVSKSGKGYTAK